MQDIYVQNLHVHVEMISLLLLPLPCSPLCLITSGHHHTWGSNRILLFLNFISNQLKDRMLCNKHKGVLTPSPTNLKSV